MEAVFGLLEDEGTLIVKQLTSDFITAMRRQAMHNPAIIPIKQLCIQLIGHHLFQPTFPLLGETRLGEELHVYPRIGIDNITFSDGFPPMETGPEIPIRAPPLCRFPQCLILSSRIDFRRNDGNFQPNFHPGGDKRIADVVVNTDKAHLNAFQSAEVLLNCQ